MQSVFRIRRKRNAMLLASMLALFLLLATGLMLMELGHRCAGFDCEICAGILSLRAILVHISVLFFAALAFGRLGKLPRLRLFAAHFRRTQSTPVSLYDRMND